MQLVRGGRYFAMGEGIAEPHSERSIALRECILFRNGHL